MLLPAAPQDWLPAGHLAHFINDTVDALDLKAFCARCEGGSRNQPFHPAMMVKVLVYAYATGVFSSRKIERRLHEDPAFRMLAAGNFPRHRTTCGFRAARLEELSALFVPVVKLAHRGGGGAGPGRPGARRGRRPAVPAHRGDGRQAQDRRRSGGPPQAQVDRRAAQRLDQDGASLMEGGWRVRSNTPELPRGGGSGEPCVKPQPRRLRGFCRADS